MQTWRNNRAVSWTTVALMLWLFIGANISPRLRFVTPAQSGNIASALAAFDTHASCKCVMCKSGKKSCCCAPKSGTPCYSSRCDGAVPDDATPVPVPRAVLPPALLTQSPAVCALLRLAAFAPVLSCAGRISPPLPPPPQSLSLANP